jgi:hypothetical protein
VQSSLPESRHLEAGLFQHSEAQQGGIWHHHDDYDCDYLSDTHKAPKAPIWVGVDECNEKAVY